MVGAVKDFIDLVLVADRPVEAHIAGGGVVHQFGAVFHRLGCRGDGRPLIQVGLDQRRRAFRRFFCFGDDHGDGIAHMADLALRQ